MIQTLEAPYSDLVIHADTEVERTKRVNALSKEPETVHFIESLPEGSVFYDIGACVGGYSLIAAKHGLEVYAFEPAPFNSRRLKQNVSLNDLEDRIRVFPWALSNKSGYIGMDFSSEEIGSAEHRLIERGGIACYRLDELAENAGLPVPDAVKIDVDGQELDVVEGGKGLWPEVSAVQVEIDDSLPGWANVMGWLYQGGLRPHRWTRHGDTSISNVLFKRRVFDA